MEGGCWGLVIVASAFFIQFLAFGTSGAIGVYNIELLDYFDNDTVGVSLISAINLAVFLGSGPIASYLMTKMSYRKISLLGSVLVALGVILMPFLPYIPALCICFGILAGLGSCLVYLPSHVLSGLYYDKHRSLATGVATSGSGLGGAVMPIVAGYLIHYYGWKGSLIVLSGLNLNLIVFSALLRKPPSINELEPDDVAKPSESVGLLVHDDEMNQHRAQPETLSGWPSEGNPAVLKHLTNDLSEAQSSSGTVSNGTIVENVSEKHDCQCSGDNNERHVDELRDGEPNFEPTRRDTLAENDKGDKVLRHVYLFTDFGFCVYFFNNLLWNVTGAMIMTFAAEFVVERGYDPIHAAWLASIGGFGCFLGGLLGGLLGNLFQSHRLALYVVSNWLFGVFTALVPFGSEYRDFVCILLSAGLMFGMVLGLLIVVLTDIIGPKNLADGMGYLMLANGAGCFIGPALTGYLRKVLGSYDPAFYTGGAISVAAGVSMLVIPLLKPYCSRKDVLPDNFSLSVMR